MASVNSFFDMASQTRRVGEEQNRIPAGAEADALMARGEKARAPHAFVKRLCVGLAAGARDHRDVGGQIFVLCAETVGDPCAK